MMNALSLKIVVAVFGITAFVLGVAGYLTYSNFEKSTLSLIEGRTLHIVRELRSAIATGLGLGLPLSTMSNVQAIIARELGKDPQIAAIAVFDRDGREVFSIGDREAAVLPEMHVPCGDAEWCHSLERFVVVGSQLRDAVGLPAGSVALWYSRASYETLQERMRRRIAWSASAILSVVVALSIIVVPRLLNLFWASHERMRRISGAAIGRTVDESSPCKDGEEPGSDFVVALHAASEVTNRIGECAHDLRRLCRDR